MTKEEAEQVLKTADEFFAGMGARIIEHPTPETYAIAIPASQDDADLWHLITEYDVNHAEQLRAIAYSPYVTRLSLTPDQA